MFKVDLILYMCFCSVSHICIGAFVYKLLFIFGMHLHHFETFIRLELKLSRFLVLLSFSKFNYCSLIFSILLVNCQVGPVLGGFVPFAYNHTL